MVGEGIGLLFYLMGETEGGDPTLDGFIDLLAVRMAFVARDLGFYHLWCPSTRDFTDATRLHLLATVREVEANRWNEITDWWGDKALQLANTIGVLKILNDADSYQTMLLDMNNTSEKELQAIFDKVYSIDADYASKFQGYSSSVQGINTKIKGLAERIAP